MRGDPSAAGNDPAAALPSFAIAVQNASGTTLALQTATLASGAWLPPAPAIGSGVFPGDAPRYVNVSLQAFSGLGGTLILVPMTGGSITIGWSWPSGGTPAAAAYGQNTSISVDGTLINVGSSQPTFQVVVGTS